MINVSGTNDLCGGYLRLTPSAPPLLVPPTQLLACSGPTRASLSGAHNTAPALDHSAVASLQRQIERLLHERRLRLAIKLIDQFNLALQFNFALALTLDEVRTRAVLLSGRKGHFQRYANSASTGNRPPHPPPGLYRYYPPLTQPRLGVRCLRIDQCIHTRRLLH
jgi:hypothetical protein